MRNEMKPCVPVPEVKRRRSFDRVFKQEAVNNWLASGKPAEVIAEELGISANCLYNWRKALNIQAVKAAASPDPASELAALRLELERVRQQRDILKKTLGILSEPPSSALNGSRR